MPSPQGEAASASRPRTRPERHSLPSWFRVQLNPGRHYIQIKRLTEEYALHTICEEARCPNIWECWNNQTATLMILGDICTRRCEYCSVHTGQPNAVDPDEALRVALAVERLGLRHVVITSPNRDDLTDGGSAAFASTISHIRTRNPHCRIEALIPDFKETPMRLTSLLMLVLTS